jgi:predicted nucleic acid-binding Zn ribbon protein
MYRKVCPHVHCPVPAEPIDQQWNCDIDNETYPYLA